MFGEFNWDSLLHPRTLAIIMGCAIPIVAIISGYWYKVRKAESESKLKRTLAERGMSAEEIERVVSAKGHG